MRCVICENNFYKNFSLATKENAKTKRCFYKYIYNNMILRNVVLIFKSVIACQKKRLQIIKYQDCNINDFVMAINFIRQSSR